MGECMQQRDAALAGCAASASPSFFGGTSSGLSGRPGRSGKWRVERRTQRQACARTSAAPSPAPARSSGRGRRRGSPGSRRRAGFRSRRSRIRGVMRHVIRALSPRASTASAWPATFTFAPDFGDPAVRVDQEGRALHAHVAAAVHAFFLPDAIGFEDARDPRPKAGAPSGRAWRRNRSCFLDRIGRQAEDRDAGLLELVGEGRERDVFGGAACGVVLRIEEQDDGSIRANRARDRGRRRRSAAKNPEP